MRMENESKSAYRAWPNIGYCVFWLLFLFHFFHCFRYHSPGFSCFVITLQFFPTCLFVQGNAAQLNSDRRCFSQDRAFVLFAIKRSSIAFIIFDIVHIFVAGCCCTPNFNIAFCSTLKSDFPLEIRDSPIKIRLVICSNWFFYSKFMQKICQSDF